MNLIEDRGTRAELHKKVNVGVLAILTPGYRAKHLDVQCMPTSKETLDLLRMRNHDVPNLTHKGILTERAPFTFGSTRQEPKADIPISKRGLASYP